MRFKELTQDQKEDRKKYLSEINSFYKEIDVIIDKNNSQSFKDRMNKHLSLYKITNQGYKKILDFLYKKIESFNGLSQVIIERNEDDLISMYLFIYEKIDNKTRIDNNLYLYHLLIKINFGFLKLYKKIGVKKDLEDFTINKDITVFSTFKRYFLDGTLLNIDFIKYYTEKFGFYEINEYVYGVILREFNEYENYFLKQDYNNDFNGKDNIRSKFVLFLYDYFDCDYDKTVNELFKNAIDSHIYSNYFNEKDLFLNTVMMKNLKSNYEYRVLKKISFKNKENKEINLKVNKI